MAIIYSSIHLPIELIEILTEHPLYVKRLLSTGINNKKKDIGLPSGRYILEEETDKRK